MNTPAKITGDRSTAVITAEATRAQITGAGSFHALPPEIDTETFNLIWPSGDNMTWPNGDNLTWPD